ncbi:dihydrolipoamide s-acetyltransferase [Nannochloropsis oceanica]
MVLHAVTRRLLNCPAAATCVRATTAHHFQPQQQQRAFLALPAAARKTAPLQHPSIDPSCHVLLKITPLHRPFATAGGEGSSNSSSSSKSDQPPHFKLILPDIGQSTKTGHVTTWRKEEGDLIKNGDVVCEVEMDQFNVGMEIDDKGFLARILVPAGTRDVPAGEALAVLVYEEKDIDSFKQLPRYHSKGGEGGGEGGAVAADGDEDAIAVDGVTLLKFLHKLARNGSIKDKEFSKKLQSLARHEDKQLLRVFEASFEGEGTRREEDFDVEFFLEEGRGIVHELEEVEQAADKGRVPSSSSDVGKEV